MNRNPTKPDVSAGEYADRLDYEMRHGGDHDNVLPVEVRQFEPRKRMVSLGTMAPMAQQTVRRGAGREHGHEPTPSRSSTSWAARHAAGNGDRPEPANIS